MNGQKLWEKIVLGISAEQARKYIHDHQAVLHDKIECGLALRYAAWYDKIDIAKMLVEEFSVDVNSDPRGDGYTALAAASDFNHPEMMKYLIDHSADVHKKCTFGGVTAHWNNESPLEKYPSRVEPLWQVHLMALHSHRVASSASTESSQIHIGHVSHVDQPRPVEYPHQVPESTSAHSSPVGADVALLAELRAKDAHITALQHELGKEKNLVISLQRQLDDAHEEIQGLRSALEAKQDESTRQRLHDKGYPLAKMQATNHKPQYFVNEVDMPTCTIS